MLAAKGKKTLRRFKVGTDVRKKQVVVVGGGGGGGGGAAWGG